MTSVEEFIAARISIEALVAKIAQSLEDKVMRDSKENLDEANSRLEMLKTMVANDVQVVVAGRLSRQLADLGTRVGTMSTKVAAKKTVEKKTPGKSSGRKKLN